MVIVAPGAVLLSSCAGVSSTGLSTGGGFVGMTGDAAVTLVDGADAFESPLAEWATTVIVYGWSACAPMMQLVGLAVVLSQVAGPGEAIAVYPVTGAPPGA